MLSETKMILTMVLFIYVLLGFGWSFYCLVNSCDIKDMIENFLFVEKFKSGNWFGKTLIVLLIIILSPHIIIGMILGLIIFGCFGIYELIQKIGGWDK